MSRTPIMYNDGAKWHNWDCFGTAKGNKGIFVGGGPSLNKMDTSKLTGPGKTVVGVNNTYPQVRPDIWVGMDDPNCYDQRVFHEGFPKIMRGGYQTRDCQGKQIQEFPNTMFANVGKPKTKYEILGRIGPDATDFVWHNNVFATTLNMMMHMGFKEIYLAGVDLDNSEGDYAHGKELTKSLKDWNQHLYTSLREYLSWLSKAAAIEGIMFYSISPDSLINDIVPYVSLDDLNESLELPEPGDLSHSRDIEDSNVVSADYKSQLKKLHASTVWGETAQNMVGRIKPVIDKYDCKELVDYGSGHGGFRKALNDSSYKIHEYDPGIVGKDAPAPEKDFLLSIDVLEHIEPDKIDAVLGDMRRIMRKAGFFSIATGPARKILPDGRNAHLIIEDADWWTEKVSKYFTIVDTEVHSYTVEFELLPL